jgi:putative copper export protein
LACFAVLAATGTFNLWVRGVRFGDVLRPEWRETTFGQLLLVKAGLVVAVIAMTIAHERLVNPSVARWTGRSLLVVGLAIVWIAVLLVRAI